MEKDCIKSAVGIVYGFAKLPNDKLHGLIYQLPLKYQKVFDEYHAGIPNVRFALSSVISDFLVDLINQSDDFGDKENELIEEIVDLLEFADDAYSEEAWHHLAVQLNALIEESGLIEIELEELD